MGSPTEEVGKSLYKIERIGFVVESRACIFSCMEYNSSSIKRF